MDELLLQEIEISLIFHSHTEKAADKGGNYYEILKDARNGNYNSVLCSGVVGQLFQLEDVDLSCCDAQLLQTVLRKNIENFVAVESKQEAYLRQLVVLSVGVSCLQLFVQNNWVGPPTSCSLWSLPSLASDVPSCGLPNISLYDCIHAGLTVDADSINQLSLHPLYLFLARIILWTCGDLITDCQTSGLWLLRFIKTLQSMMEERSITLKDLMLQTVNELTSKPLFSGCVPNTDNLRIQFHLEVGHLCYFYYVSTLARHHFTIAKTLSHLSVELTGVLGKRTKFQTKNISQLVLLVKPTENVVHTELDNNLYLCNNTDRNLLPKSIRLDDESVLEELHVADSENISVCTLSSVQQAVILGLCHDHRLTHESEGQGRIVQEELMAHINFVLAQPVSWCVQTMALLLRSKWEKDSARRLNRSVSQLEELVKQFRVEGSACAYDRLSLVYAVSLPPLCAVEQELGRLYDAVGAVSAALDIYLRLNLWEEVIACYTKLGHKAKAEKLIREQLAMKETPQLWCCLGDVTSDPEHYHHAFQLSNEKNARSQRSLAYYYFNRREMKTSLQYFQKSLQLSPLQVGVWFTFGCSSLECQEYELAATAFRRCVNLDSDNFAAWNNLATSYIKANNKQRAFLTYQEALKCDYENWRIWENYLAVSTDVGEFEEAINAYHRLLELRDKYTDVAVLNVLVRAVCDKLNDAAGEPADRLKPKLLKLFGHVTSSVTSCSEIWSLYAKLLTCDGTTDNVTLERALKCLKSAHSCAILSVNWEKDVTKCVEMCQLSHQLAAAYLQCASILSQSADIDRVKSSGRLMVRGVLAKIKKQYADSMPDELSAPLQLLEEDSQNLTNAIQS